MFGFFKDIKTSLAALHAKLDAVLNHVTAAPPEVKAEVAEAVTKVETEVKESQGAVTSEKSNAA